jgi:hypothetical protein
MEFDRWLAQKLTKEEATGVKEAFVSADIENLPPGQTAWRASNAISWFAHSINDPERRFEFDKLAGEMLLKAKAS